MAPAFEFSSEMASSAMSAMHSTMSAHQRPMPVMHAHVCHRVQVPARGSAWHVSCFATRRPALRLVRRCPVTAQADGQQAMCRQRRPTPEWLLSSAAGLWLLGEMPAFAETDFSQGSFSAGSYYVSLGLFLVTLPGAIRARKPSPPPSPGTLGHPAHCRASSAPRHR